MIYFISFEILALLTAGAVGAGGKKDHYGFAVWFALHAVLLAMDVVRYGI